MNRSIALFVALVTLLAHTLAIHSDRDGSFAFPYDQAYAGFRLARNLVFDGQMAWNPGMSAFESYPSFLWVLVCGVGERVAPYFHLSMNAFVQTIGIACMLATVLLSARFRSDRIASLLAPLFLATSGCIAAAAANGLDTALFTFACLASFLALERGYSWRLAIALSVCCLTRPEGVIIALALLVLRLFGKPNDDEGERARVPIGAFVLPALVVGATCVIRWRSTGFVLPPIAEAYTNPYPGQWRAGVVDLRDFLLSTVSPLLLAFPAWYLVRGMLSRTGAHAVFVALVWTIFVSLRGRTQLPFHEALVPALPFLFLGVQEGVIVALDGLSRVRRQLTVFAVVACLVGSVLASLSPGDLGPIPFRKLHEAWMKPSEPSKFDSESQLGRTGLQEEISQTGSFRYLGLFLRDFVDSGSTILTPWPGAIGYLSHQPVFDVLGRTDPLHPTDRPRTWARRERADTVALLQQDFDYVVPLAHTAKDPVSKEQLARAWLEGLDEKAADTGRLQELETALDRYELITVPIHEFVARGQPRVTEPFHLLRARHLDVRPHLEMRGDGGFFRVVVFHRSHPQLADLHVSLVTADGRSLSLRPTCELSESPDVHARSGILLYDTGARGVELMRGKLPPPPSGTHWTELRAVLRNPESRGHDPFAFASDELHAPL